MLADLPLPAHIRARSYGNADAMAQALATDIAERLKQAISEQGRALLRVSGGRSPVVLFEALAEQALPWSQVLIGLVDERWSDRSNEQLLRRHLQRSLAAQACVVGLRPAAASLELAAQLASRCQRALAQTDVMLLGMGDDGHCASLFPNSPNLAMALEADAPLVTAQWAPVNPTQRLSLSVPAILNARQRLLLIQGQAKLHTLAAALQGSDAYKLPIRAVLTQPLDIYWCP